MKVSRFVVCVVTLASALVITGCSEDSSDSLFSESPAKIKQAWAGARRLDAANDYFRAAQAYDELVGMELSSKQTAAVQIAVNRLYDRVNKAAAKGDPNAKEIVNRIKASGKSTD